jgi:hypothetical protein
VVFFLLSANSFIKLAFKAMETAALFTKLFVEFKPE